MDLRAAIFDLDGTLLTGNKNVMPALVRVLWRSGYRRLRAVPLLAAAGLVLIIRKLRLIDSETYTLIGTRMILAWMAGDRPADLAPYFEKVVHSNSPRRSMVAELRLRQEEGCACVVVSAVIQPLLEHFGALFGCQAAGTPLELDAAGRLTGRMAGPYCSGPGKVAAVQAWAARFDQPVNWRESYAYGDTLPDLPMLQLVGHPTAVAPAPDLLKEATSRGWRVLSA